MIYTVINGVLFQNVLRIHCISLLKPPMSRETSKFLIYFELNKVRRIMKENVVDQKHKTARE